MDYGKIAVIMTAYNEKKEWLSKAIESVLSQTYINIHLYLLLDNPNNKELEELIIEYAKKDSRVSCYINEKNLGLVESLNKLLLMVTEEYIARMDADDICIQTRLEDELLFLRDNSLDFVMSGIDFIKNEVIQEGPKIPLLLSDSFEECQKYGNFSAHPTWLLKKEVYDSLKGYRNITSCEDLDFVLRAIQTGYKIGRIDKALLHYRVRESGMSGLNAYEQYTKSRILHKAYANGKLISEIDVEGLNEKCLSFTDAEKKEFAYAKSRIDELAENLYKHQYLACLGNVIINFVSNALYRDMFCDLFINNRKVQRIFGRIRM